MKRLFYIGLFFLLTLISLSSFSQYQTQDSGLWHHDNTWLGAAPPYSFNNNANIRINLNNDVLASETILFNNNGNLDILGHLEVTGNITSRNNLGLSVKENGTLIVHGDVVVKNNVTLELNGNMQVNNLYGQNNNYLIGEGNLYLLGEIDGFNTDYFNGAIVNDPLPIALLSFEAEIIEKDVIIKWTTASEINNDYFTVEKSHNAKNWEILGFIPGSGNSNNTINYDFADYQCAEGIWYYRLKQTDFDGQFEYFKPIAVNISYSNNLQIINAHTYNEQTTISLKTAGRDAALLISDINGRIIHAQEVTHLNHIQKISINLNIINSGSFIVFNLFDNSDKTSLKHLIK